MEPPQPLPHLVSLGPIGQQELDLGTARRRAAKCRFQLVESESLAIGGLIGQQLNANSALCRIDQRHQAGQIPECFVRKPPARAEDRGDLKHAFSPTEELGKNRALDSSHPGASIRTPGEQPIRLEDVEQGTDGMWKLKADPELLDVLQRPPIEVLASQKSLPAIDHEVFGVKHS